MRNHSIPLFGLAALSALLVGCGGGGSTPSDSVGKSVGVVGGAESVAATSASSVASQPFSQDVTVGGISAVAPPGVTFAAGDTVALIATPSPILALEGTGLISAQGVTTGLTLINGQLSSPVALPPTSVPYNFVVQAPVGGLHLLDTSVSRGAPSRATTLLTINGSLTLGVLVRNDGTAGIPTSITGTVPANGSNKVKVDVTVAYPTSFATDYQATLSIGYTANSSAHTISQTRAVASDGTVHFTASGATPIPVAGVDTITLILSHV